MVRPASSRPPAGAGPAEQDIDLAIGRVTAIKHASGTGMRVSPQFCVLKLAFSAFRAEAHCRAFGVRVFQPRLTWHGYALSLRPLAAVPGPASAGFPEPDAALHLSTDTRPGPFHLNDDPDEQDLKYLLNLHAGARETGGLPGPLPPVVLLPAAGLPEMTEDDALRVDRWRQAAGAVYGTPPRYIPAWVPWPSGWGSPDATRTGDDWLPARPGQP